MFKVKINSDFNGNITPFMLHIDKPVPGYHPLHFQAAWLLKNHGGVIPPNVMDAVTQLYDLSVRNGCSFEELCIYAFGTLEEVAALEATFNENQN